MTPPTDTVRPTWRGVLHRWATVTYIPLFGVMIALASGGGDRIAVIVYAFGVTAMLGVSATYHSGRLGPVGMRRIKRVDHSTILVAIAGSYTAIATLALDGAPARTLLIAIWIAAPLGVAIRMAWLDAPYPVAATVYVVVGWIAVIEFGALVDALTGVELALVVIGGLLYTAGGVVYALHKPNPKPAVFGYHEVFHALVVAGVTAHYVAMLLLVRNTRVSDLDAFASLVALDHGLVVVSTGRADGTIQSSVVNAGVLDHPVTGRPVVAFVAAGSSKRLTNLRARPRATVVLRAGWQWAGVEGSVELAGPDDPLDGIDAERLRVLLRDIFTAAGGTHDDWDEYDRAMATERRVAVLVEPERVYGNS